MNNHHTTTSYDTARAAYIAAVEAELADDSWWHQPHPELGGRSPYDYLDQLDTFDPHGLRAKRVLRLAATRPAAATVPAP